MWSRIKRLLLFAGLTAVAITGLATLVLSSSAFDGLRRTWIAAHLTEATGLDTDIGFATVGIGSQFNIEIRDVRIDDGSLARLSIEDVRFSIPISVLWSDHAAMHAFRLSGVRWDMSTAEHAAAPSAVSHPEESGWSPDTLSAFDFRDIVVKNGVLRLHASDSERAQIALEHLRAQPGEGENRITLDVVGTVDGTALQLTGGFDDPNATANPSGVKFDLAWLHPGLSGAFEGAVDLSRKRPEINATLSAKTEAPETLSQLLGLEGEFDGAGQLAGRIEGPVASPIIKDLRVEFRDLAIETNVIGNIRDRISVRRADFSLSTTASPAGDLRAHNIELEGLVADLQGDHADKDNQPDARNAFGFTLSPDILQTVDFKSFALFNATVRFRNGVETWEHILEIVSLTARPHATENRAIMDVSGTLNESPFEIAAIFDDPNATSEMSAIRFDVSSEIPGLRSKIDGSLDLMSAAPTIDAELTANSNSLTRLLETLGFSANWNSAGHLAGRLQGALGRPALNEIEMVVEKNRELRVGITGKVGNLLEGAGIDLAFTGTIGDENRLKPENAGLLEVEMREFQGKARGSLQGLAFEELRFVTNVLSADLKEIGPVRIGRAIHDENGKLRLEDIRILDGPEDMPYLDLVGNVGDALELENMEFQGTINVSASDVLAPQSGVDTDSFGRLQGEIAFSRKSGTFAFDGFDARVVDSKVLALTLALNKGDESKSRSDALKTDLSVPDLSKLAAALGHKLKNPISFRFAGTMAFKQNDPEMQGTITIGDTILNADLAGNYSDGAQKVVGSIQSQKLGLDDLHYASDALLLLSESNLQVSKDHLVIEASEELTDRIGADIKIDIKSIEGAGKAASHIRGRIRYLDDVLDLDPVQMRFLGGSLATSIRLDLSKTPVIQSHKGQVDNMPLGRVLKELEIPQTVTGTIFAKYDVTTAGDSMATSATNLSGTATFSLFDSTIGADLIDLTGMNTVSWLFSGKSKSSKVKCIVAPLSFKNGRGSTGGLVIETDRIQVIGKGAVDLRENNVDITFEPRALARRGVGVASRFRLSGQLDDPKVQVGRAGGAGRAAAEIVTAPLNIVGVLFGKGKEDKTKKAGRKPCEPIETAAVEDGDAAGPKKKNRRK